MRNGGPATEPQVLGMLRVRALRMRSRFAEPPVARSSAIFAFVNQYGYVRYGRRVAFPCFTPCRWCWLHTAFTVGGAVEG